jgi:arabinan endo-1,5-alpha-L-arabinosidase
MSFPSNILLTPSLTIEAWVTPRISAAWQRILDFGTAYPQTPGGSFDYLMLAAFGAPGEYGQLKLGLFAATGYDAVATSTNVEHQFVLTYDYPSQTVDVYLDGVLEASDQGYGYGESGNPAAADFTHFWIGRSSYPADPYFDGTIDELRTYDNALSPDQVEADFLDGPNDIPEPALGILPVSMLLICSRLRRTRDMRACVA